MPEKVFNRAKMIDSIDPSINWDVVVIGGGATGLGTALEAASRGYSTILIEQHDFSKGTSSRSTKLVHGGVRYLAQGNIKLVYGALHERGLLLNNAPHVVKPLSFIIPCYSYWSRLKYVIGLKFYDLLSGKYSFGKSAWVTRDDVVKQFPNIVTRKLLGGVRYYDGQFDDARLAIDIARTAAQHGATVLNYMRADRFVKESGKITGVVATDMLTGTSHTLRAKSVVNATGIFVDDIMQMDDASRKPVVTTSQGVHIVLDKKFVSDSQALMIPETSDGRVIFAVPWHDRLIVGTTDNLLTPATPLEPTALQSEINFLLATIGAYLVTAPQRKDILSVFAGLRPLAASSSANKSTKEISRSHKITVSPAGLVTTIGGKWTTYRQMGEETVDAAASAGGLAKMKSRTENIHIHGYAKNKPGGRFLLYGSESAAIEALIAANPAWGAPLANGHGYTLAEVVWAVREEMAITIEDVLARRLRLLFTDAAAAIGAATTVGEILMKELHLTEESKERQHAAFLQVAQNYLVN